MCLLVGASGVGKTLLSKRLQAFAAKGSANLGDAPSTIPTVGTNLVTLSTGRKQDVTVRELGGCMAPIWHKYFENTNRLIFVIDVSNRMQVSTSCIMLLTILKNGNLQNTVFLLVLNKVDSPGCMNRIELNTLMKLDEMMKYAKQHITVLEVSAKEASGLGEVLKWLQDT
ncbi:ADP-ribosylation factor-like protein 16 [Tubulanus polymorphus]|uniref:ADP-ribosylation factor-like protein 16 n=1 Tax=Tubulanus polymorphus TaxID=672921 RepID=UPI003DA552F3